MNEEMEPKLKDDKKSILRKPFFAKYMYLLIIGLVLMAGVSYGLTFFVQDKQVATGHMGITIGYINYYDDTTLLHTERVYAGNTNKASYIPSNSSGFLGWATTNGGSVVYNTGDTVTFASTTNLYAVYDINVMGFFPQTILNQKATLEEIHFIIEDEESINSQYNGAYLKADLTYNNRGMVKCWIANNKLYIGATSKIYLYDTYDSTNELGLFEGFSSVTEIDFGNNVNTSMVVDMREMFRDCSSLTTLDVSTFNTSNVTTMASMFNGCSSLPSLNLSNFNTSSVVYMNYMFCNCGNLLTLDLSNFDTRNVTNMTNMFNGPNTYDSRLTTIIFGNNFDTSKVTNMSYMFCDCTSLVNLDVSHFNTSNVEDMSYMFNRCYALPSISLINFDTTKVTNMYQMFFRCYVLTNLDLSSFNTAAVTDMTGMFRNCTNLATIYVGRLWSTSAVTTSTNMFTDSTNLVGGNGTPYNSSYVDKTYARRDIAASVGYLTLSGVVPDAYQKVTYIESDGTAYIDTGYYPTPTTRIETEFKFNATTAQQRLFSTNVSIADTLVYTFYINSSNNFGYGYQDSGNNWRSLSITADTNKHNLRFNSDGLYVRFDSSYNQTIVGTATITSPNTLLLLADRSSSGAIANYAQARIYYLFITTGTMSSSLHRFFVPCIRKSDNVVGLYDTVGGTFYTAAEAGTSFTAGPEIH